ncbi:hypothetical protein Peur_069904 [Populus x canadensis]
MKSAATSHLQKREFLYAAMHEEELIEERFSASWRTFQAEVFKSATNLFENLSSATQEIEIAVFWSFLSDLNY